MDGYPPFFFGACSLFLAGAGENEMMIEMMEFWCQKRVGNARYSGNERYSRGLTWRKLAALRGSTARRVVHSLTR